MAEKIAEYFRSKQKSIILESSQVNTLLKAKSKTRNKQNKDMHKFSSVYSERGARRQPRRPVRCPRQPRQRSTSAAPSCARNRARQLKKKILNTFPTICGCFVLGCQCFVARIYCDGQYFYWAARLVFGNKRGN
jgi:hypothetical protein